MRIGTYVYRKGTRFNGRCIYVGFLATVFAATNPTSADNQNFDYHLESGMLIDDADKPGTAPFNLFDILKDPLIPRVFTAGMGALTLDVGDLEDPLLQSITPSRS